MNLRTYTPADTLGRVIADRQLLASVGVETTLVFHNLDEHGPAPYAALVKVGAEAHAAAPDLRIVDEIPVVTTHRVVGGGR